MYVCHALFCLKEEKNPQQFSMVLISITNRLNLADKLKLLPGSENYSKGYSQAVSGAVSGRFVGRFSGIILITYVSK